MIKRGITRPSKKANLGTLIALFALLVLFVFAAPAFFKSDNILNMFRSLSTNMLLTLGVTMCLLIGGTDLSIGQSVALCNICAAILIIRSVPWYFASLAAISLGTFLGAINGVIIAYANVPPFIQTLAMKVILEGLSYIIGNAETLMITESDFSIIGNGSVFGFIPIPTIIMFAVAGIFAVIASKTSFGGKMFAIGGNLNAAKYSGINIRRVQIICYALSGMTAGLAGTITLARLLGGQPDIGSGKELTAIASAVIGGVSFAGGKGTIGGAVFGAIFIGCLLNGLNVWGLNTYWQDIVTGFVLLAALLFNFISDRIKGKNPSGMRV